ncbi:MAG: hypothetical protein NT131_05970 [Methanomassiliicoccales archaeon]|nr:hypothetical protein [Methanomassiliicoccales archaeon]
MNNSYITNANHHDEYDDDLNESTDSEHDEGNSSNNLNESLNEYTQNDGLFQNYCSDENTNKIYFNKKDEIQLANRKGFEDILLYDLINNFSKKLIDDIDKNNKLRGVHYWIEIYPVEELDKKIINFELRIPGIKGDEHKLFWGDFLKLFNDSKNRFIESLGKSSYHGRQFAKFSPNFSISIVPY